MSQLFPTGTVTFLFTDIEGSTRLAQKFGADYPALVADHFSIIRAEIGRSDGVEVNTTGDGIFAAFPSAGGALRVAAEIQHRMYTQDWPEGGDVSVRVGVHTGEATLADGDYVGVDVHKAARIMAAGHGGQVLASESARLLAALAAFSVVAACTYQSTGVTAGSAEQPAVVPESTTTVQEQFEQPAPAVEPSTTVMAATTTVPDSAAPASTAPEANQVSFEGLSPEQQEAVDLVCRYAETGSGDRLLIANMILSGGTGVTAWEDNIGPTLRDASSPDEVGTADH